MVLDEKLTYLTCGLLTKNGATIKATEHEKFAILKIDWLEVSFSLMYTV